jgi:hypothetical protein
LREEAKSRLVAQKSRSKSTIRNLEVFKDKGYNISDLLNKTNISEEKYTWIQGIIAREAEIEPVKTRSLKRALKRDALYAKDQTLQERL